MLMASTPPAPSTSAYTPDMSSMSPITSWSAAACAGYGPAAMKVAAQSAMVQLLNFIGVLLSRNGVRSNPEIFVQQRHFGLKLASREARDDPPTLHYVEAVGERRGETEVLLHHDDGVAALAQPADGACERLHDHRSEPFRDL